MRETFGHCMIRNSLGLRRSGHLLKQSQFRRLLYSQDSSTSSLSSPANEGCEGYIFTRFCLSTGREVSRPKPRGGWGVWLGGGLQAHTGGEDEGSGGGVSKHTPGGGCVQAWGVSQHALRQTPSTRRLLLRAVRIVLECILVLKYYSYRGDINIHIATDGFSLLPFTQTAAVNFLFTTYFYIYITKCKCFQGQSDWQCNNHNIYTFIEVRIR